MEAILYSGVLKALGRGGEKHIRTKTNAPTAPRQAVGAPFARRAGPCPTNR
jgi:hypothetical protein